MSFGTTMQLVFGLVVMGLGCANWRSGGRWLVLPGAMSVAIAAYVMLPSSASGLRYTSLAVLAILVLTWFLTTSRSAWRHARVEMLLGGATVVTIAVTTFFENMPSDVRKASVALVFVLGTAFIATVLRGTATVLRAARSSKPR